MNQQELKQILSSKFDFEKWKDLLGMMFSKIDYLLKPIQIDADLVKNGGQVGVIRLDDGRSLGLFIFEVADYIQIARNRKGLRDIAIKYVDQDIIHGALVFYYSENQADYRLTFVSKQTSLNDDGSFETKATAPKRYTFLLGANEPCTTAANRLLELINKKKYGSVYLDDVKEAFSVERLNKDFFKGYKEQYFKFLDLIGKESKDNRDYVKKLLGRLVFLQFLQKKGWIGVPADRNDWEGGDKNYLYNLIQKHKGNDRLLSDVLEVLFFNTLNEKRPNDIADSILGDNIKIPYLNGGLFDKDDLDKKDIDFPYAYFKELMEFFGMYNFTIDENDPDDAEVGVDPEMLGHIFENLLEDNKDKGAFYTPKEIVQYMSQESIAQYLKTHTDETLHPSIDALIKRRVVSELLQNKASATAVYNLLQQVKVCDPAIGSGAFPMGVLNVLYHARLLLYGFTKPTQEFSPANVKREIIQNNIYGVDIEKGAVDIARLRFWLALVVDETQPHTLPNLDYKIMCGNSLIHRFALDTPFHNVLKHYNRENKANLTLDDYRQWVYEYTDISDHTQKDIFRQKIEEIKNAFKTELTDKEKGKLSKVRGAIENLQAKDIFGEQIGSAVEIKKLQKQLKELEQQRDNIESNKIYEDAFEWRFEFPALLDKEGDFMGFDVVIGNPPYLRIQGIRESDSVFADYLSKHFKSATGSFDLYVTFVEKGLSLVNHSGFVNYIMPTKWTNSAFGKGLRKLVSEKEAAHKIINFGAYQVFNASTYTGLQWFKPHSKLLKYFELNKDLISNEALKNYLYSLCDERATTISSEKLSESQWVLTNNIVAEILNRLEQQPRRIKDVFDKIFQGLATSKDDVYFLYDCIENGDYIVGESKQLGCKIQIEKGLVRPLLKGEDVHRYDAIKTNRYVVFPYLIQNGKAVLFQEVELSKQYPQGYAYLKKCEDVLRERENGRFDIDGEWFQYGRKQGIQFAEKEKLVARDISMGGDFAYDVNGEFYQTTTIYGYIKKIEIKESYKFWMALLNSRLCWWYMANTGTVLANGFFRYKPDYINPFPVPKSISKEAEKAITILVDYIITIKSLPNDIMVDEYVEKEAIIRQFENIIDALLYELYFPVEFKQVDISFVDPVLSSFTPIDSKNNQEAVDTIRISFAQFRDMNNRIRNNLKYMSIKLESLLAPIINI